MGIFKIKYEERLLVLLMLMVFLAFNVLLVSTHYTSYTSGAQGGFWTLFSRNFRMSGYDCWSWITVSGMRIHFATIRHPLYLTFLYPMYCVNHWLMGLFGYNFAVYFIGAIIVFSAVYSVVFSYRIFREVVLLSRLDSTLLCLLLFSFGHVLVPTMVPDHFVISMMLLTMTLYISGVKMQKGRLLTRLQTALLLFFTAGMAFSNGIKTVLAAWFVNGHKIFRPKFLFLALLLPIVLLLSIRQVQYHLLEVPQQKVVARIEKAKLEKDSANVAAHHAKRNSWIKKQTGNAPGNGPVTSLMNISTPRMQTLYENFFGESIQLHHDHLMEDIMFSRPVFVPYGHWGFYAVELIIVLLFVAGVLVGCRQRFMQMLLCWFSVDVMLHIIMGFGISEVYIMASGWIFIIPVAIAFLMRRATPTGRKSIRILLLLLVSWLWCYNGSMLVNYLLSFAKS